MTQIINLAPVPNQTVSCRLGGKRYILSFKSTGTLMLATIIRDGVTIVSGMRCVAGALLIPYRSEEDASGNFAFVIDDGKTIPDYLQFGDTQTLVYYSNAEIEAARG